MDCALLASISAREVRYNVSRVGTMEGIAGAPAVIRGHLGFDKYEGLGNDFILIEAGREDVVPIALARQLCNRRRGIGADGILLLLPPKTAGSVGAMVVINADGSVPEMCGNGVRCLALHVARSRDVRGHHREPSLLTFDTGAGTRQCTVHGVQGEMSPYGDASSALITVDMGRVTLTEDVALDVDGDTWEFAIANAGNPHAITQRTASRAMIEAIGPRIATHPHFPDGTNVEFVTLRSRTAMDLVVWERGVGITAACGTGACATVAVAVAKGWADADSEIAVRLLGGVLHVRIDRRGHVIMRGPARHVFHGSIFMGGADA
jgi:diaminopimelate epimerase